MSFDTVSVALLVGVFASLISMFISIVVAHIWRDLVIPWYDERVYKGPEISGAWKTTVEYGGGTTNEIIYNIERSATRISGFAYCTNGVDKGSVWDFEGTFNNLMLSIGYRSKNLKKLDRGTTTLMLVNNGALLQGHLAYYSDSEHTVKSVPMELVPADDDSKTLYDG